MTNPKIIQLEISVEEAADLKMLQQALKRGGELREENQCGKITTTFYRNRDMDRQLELVEKILEGLK